MNTTTVIVGGLIIAMVALSIGYAALTSFNHNPPLEAPVAIVESKLLLDCTMTTLTLGDFVYEVPAPVSSLLSVNVRNYLDTEVVVDAVALKSGSRIERVQLDQLLTVPPRSTAHTEQSCPQLTELVRVGGGTGPVHGVVKPGGIYRVVSAWLVPISERTHFEYNMQRIPVNNPPSNYRPQGFSVRNAVQLYTGTYTIRARLPGESFAATLLHEDLPRNQLLILAHIETDPYWLGEGTSVLFIDFYPGEFIFIHRGSWITTRPGGTARANPYIAINSTQSNIYVYLGGSTIPAITAPPASTPSIDLYMGFVRPGPPEGWKLHITYHLWKVRVSNDRICHFYFYTYVDHRTNTYEFVERSFCWKIVNNREWFEGETWRSTRGTAVLIHRNSLEANAGQFGSTPVLIVRNPTKGQRDWVFTVTYTYSDGSKRSYSFLVPAIGSSSVKDDMLIFWDYQANPITGQGGLDWLGIVVRLTEFSDNTARTAPYLARWPPNVTEIAENAGYCYSLTDAKHESSGGCWSAWLGPEDYSYIVGSYYTEDPNRVRYVQFIKWVDAWVYYLGAFTGSTVTISDLTPGRTVTFSTPGRSVNLTTTSTTLTVDLLAMFGPRELIEALKQWGGVRVSIPLSSQNTSTPELGI
ncbi:MAG: hypothetical protein QW448_09065, partial [Thermofilaceae archaeon]